MTPSDDEILVRQAALQTRETRLAILRIKASVAGRPAGRRVRSHLVYEAVLDHGIRTPEASRSYLEGS